MADVFAELRAGLVPVPPDPEFTTALRARLERALALPRGVRPMTTLSEPQTAAGPRGAAVPYLAVRDARSAIDWYVEVFGASLVGEPIVMPDGRIGHAELVLADGVIYLADEHPEIGVVAPQAGASVSLMLAVPDADEVRSRAMAAGASGDRPPSGGTPANEGVAGGGTYGTRIAWIVDPFGHRWGLTSPVQPVASVREGDVVYVSLWVPDPESAAAFYPPVVGWQISTDGGRYRVMDASPHVGLFGRPGRPDLFCCYAVSDIGSAVQRVRDAGGQAGEPSREPHGTVAECVDDQGTEFALWQIEAGTDRPTPNGRRAGDLSYLTLEVVDSAKARAFYGAVLGWTFTPGRIEDGWQVEDIAPMTGLSGGHPQATAVPMWRVDDIRAAVDRLRTLGGTATNPQRQPYGDSSECGDDQGSRFYLGEL